VIAGLKPYPHYQDTGHDWLGSVPAHWSLLRAKRLFRQVDERSKTGKEELLSVSHLTGVTPRRLKNVTMFMAESNVGHKVCRPGDLVINTLWAWMAALGVTKHTGIVSPAYGVYRPTESGGILPAYADHMLRTPLYAAEYQRRSTGVNSSRLRLYPEQFLRIPVMVPPPEEQAAIVRFLDWANGRLERAIRAKRKVIALLTEQKQATVQRGIAFGLDGGVALKPAGIPWLGDFQLTGRSAGSSIVCLALSKAGLRSATRNQQESMNGVCSRSDASTKIHSPGARIRSYPIHFAQTLALRFATATFLSVAQTHVSCWGWQLLPKIHGLS